MNKKEKLNSDGIAENANIMMDADEMKAQNSAIRSFMVHFIPSENGVPSIDDLLREVGEHFDADRAYIFEQDITRQFSVNTYEWCAEGVTPEIQNLQDIPLHVLDSWWDAFRTKGTIFLSCDDEYSKEEPLVYEVLQPQGISTLMADPLMYKDEIIGFLGVDNPKIHLSHRLFLGVAAAKLNQEVLTIRSEARQQEMHDAFDSVYFSLDAARWEIIFDKNGNMTSAICSDLFRRMIGYHDKEDFPDELSSWSNLLHPADKKKTLKTFQAAIDDHADKTKYSARYRILTRNRGYRWFAADGTVTRYENGMPKYFYGLFRDINEDVLTEQNMTANLKEISELNSQLEENQAQLEEAASEHEAQLDEISALNGQLESNQAELEASLAEQETQLEEIQAEREKVAEAYGMIEGLSQEYHTIWLVNKENLQMRLVRSNGISTAKGAVAMAEKIVELDPTVKVYVEHYVMPEDQERALREMSSAEVLRHLNENKYGIYAVNYLRKDDSGNIGYHQIAFANADTGDGKRQFVLGFRDIDKIVKEEQKRKEELQEALTLAQEATAEQEAQIEEINALNAQLQDNQTQLEEAAAEQEAQLAEIQAEREQLSEAYGMIEGLSQEYHTIWLVNKETSKMHLVRSSGKSTIKRAVQMGIDEPLFDPAFATYIGSCVEPEDRERMHREIAFAEVLRHLEANPDQLYAVNYLRRDDSGHVGYHQIAFANADTQDGKKQFVYGFRDVDAIVKEEQKQKEELKEQRDTLEKNYDAVRSLSKLFYASYYVDVDKDEHYELFSSDDIKSRYAKFGAIGKSQAALDWVCENRIAPEYREEARAFTDYSTISERMRDTDVISIRVQLVTGDWSRIRFIAGTRHEDGTIKSCTFTARNVNDEVAEEEKRNAELQSALTLAQDSATEQEAQLEEITALNTQLESNQSELEASVAEQESQLEEIQLLNAEIQNRLSVIQSAMKVYFAAIYIDLKKDSYITLKRVQSMEQRGYTQQGNAQEMLFSLSKPNICLPEYAEELHQFMDLSTLNERLKDTDTVAMQYEGVVNGWQQIYFIAGDREDDGTLKTVMMTSRLIHEEKEKELAALKEISDYNDAMANAGYGMWHIILKDGEEPRMQVNDKMAELLGIAGQDLSEEELYNSWYGQIVPEAIPSVQASVGEMMAGHFSENTYQWIHPTKGVIYVRCGGTAQKFEDGTNVLSGYHADVTDIVYEEKKQKQELENTRNAALLENEIISSISKMYFAIFRIDLAQNYYEEISSDNSVHVITGHEGNAQEKMNELCATFVTDKYRADVQEFFNLSTITERLKDLDTIEYQYHATDGNWHEARFIAKKRNENGTVTHILYVTRVISAIKQRELEAQEALEKAKDAAEAANRAKSAFLFNMSHDIRTPMNAIIGYANLMKRNPDNMDKWPDYLEKILVSSDFLLSLINNVLEMARIESGKMVLDENIYSADAFADQLYSVFLDEMGKKDLKFTKTIDVKHQYFYLDNVKLREILLNILSNAQKYTPSGGCVDMTIKELPSEVSGYSLIQTTISDTGIGMSEDFLPHIFEEFTREKNSSGNTIQGTGLGMPIVKKLVDLMGGTIEVHSKAGEGSTFIVTIPHKIAEKPAEEVKAETIDYADFAGKKILLAEDNDLNAEIAMEILSEYDFKIERAEDGVVCVDMLTKAEAGYYDVILMDIQMPNLDGYGAARTIRKMDDPLKADIPIIAMTANAFDEDKRNAIDAEMDGHVAKPIEIPILMQTLQAVFKDRSAFKNITVAQRPTEDAVTHVKKIYFQMQQSKAMSVLPGGFFAYKADDSEELIFANELCCSIWGCKNFEEFNEFVGGSFKGIVHPDDYERVEKEIWHQINSADAGLDQVKYRIVKKDGTVSSVDDYGRLIRDKEVGDIFYVFVAETASKHLSD